MIEGKMVNLRAREMSDLAHNACWSSDRELCFLNGDPYPQSSAAIEAMMREYTSRPPAYADPRFAIETRDGTHIGNLRLFEVSAENRSARLSILIGDRAYWSKGYGSDAVRTLLGFAFGEMNLNRVDLVVYEYNERAIACYRKLGFVEEARLRQARYAEGAYHDEIVMSLLRDEWAPSD